MRRPPGAEGSSRRRPDQPVRVAVHEVPSITDATDELGRFGRWFNVARLARPFGAEAFALKRPLAASGADGAVV